jgi:LuxR family maltose regulon positive regulatory protein
MARTTPRICNGVLALHEGAREQSIPLESAAWWEWLKAERHQTFYFANTLGSFTARREQKHGGWYWYAYRKRAGKLHKAYLGKAEELTLDRLNATAAALAGSSANVGTPANSEQKDQQGANLPGRASSDDLLLMTKFSVPPAHANLIERHRLIDQLTAGLDHALTLLSAPPGFGKTSLLSQWVQHSTMPVTWVTLDESDNDPVRFWHSIIIALQLAHPQISSRPQAVLHTPQQSAIEAAVTTLINALSALPEPFALILDDYHLIEASIIHQSLAFLLDHLPTQMRLIIASRTDPPLPLARLRARNQLAELHTADLRFDADETASFLNQTMRLNLPKEAITALAERTEGWIAGLHLAALSLHTQKDTAGFIAAFTGSHRYIFDYLTDEILNQQSEQIQEFLLHTSLLDRLSGPLCKAVTGQAQAQALLERLEQANLFLVPLDDERRWYRYHQLFAEVLRNRLQRIHPEIIPHLHQRAADWYERNGLIPQAIGHTLAAQDLEHAAGLIEAVAETMLKRGEGTTFLHWIEALPEAVLHARPRLSFFHAGVLIVVGRSDAAEARLQSLERELSINNGPAPDLASTETQIIVGEISAARAIVAAYEGDIEQTIALNRQALEYLPETELFGRSVLAASLGAAYWWSGSLAEADHAFAEARVISQAAGNAHAGVASLCGQGYLQMVWGKLHRAVELFQQAIQEATEPNGQILPVASLAYGGLGEVLYQWNELDQAEQALLEAMRFAKEWGDPRALSYAQAILAHVRHTQGQREGTLQLLDQAEQIAQQHHITQLITTIPASRAWLSLKQGDLDAASRWADIWGSTWEARPQYSRDLEFASLVLARVQLALDQFEKAHPLLAHMLNVARTTRRIGSFIEMLALQALVYQKQGHTPQALATLCRALLLAEPEGYIRVFADEGESMAALLSILADAPRRGRQTNWQPPISSDYLQTLLAACRQKNGDARIFSSDGLQENEGAATHLLSEREREVLRLLASGLSNQEIADQIVIAVSTVKWHIKQIYAKLDAHNRAQAIKQARILHLLP